MNNPSNGAEKAEEMANEIRQDVNELKRNLRKGAEDVKKEAVLQLNKRAEDIRREAREAKMEPDAVAQADQMAANLEKAASYLNNRSIDQMGADIDRAIDQNTGRAILITLVIGFLLGFLMRGGRR
ncbi:MAG: hypothetical protein K8I30_19660 [Anaerolineae bacterium]|nr:hypothetical protein [Anaerolineae bacterium]